MLCQKRHLDIQVPGEGAVGGQHPAGEDQLSADGRLVVQVHQHRQVAFFFGSADGRERGDFADDVMADQELRDRLAVAHDRVWRAGADARGFERLSGAFVDSEAAQFRVEPGGIANFRLCERRRYLFVAGRDQDAQVHGRAEAQALWVEAGVQRDLGRGESARRRGREQPEGTDAEHARDAQGSGHDAFAAAGRAHETALSTRSFRSSV